MIIEILTPFRKPNSAFIGMIYLATCFCFFASCSKEDGIEKAKDFANINLSHIQDIDSTLSTKEFLATNSSGFILKPNDVLVFKTSEGRYGKMQIIGYDLASNYDMTVKATVFNADGSTKAIDVSFVIRGTWLGELDVPREALREEFTGKADFHWNRQNDTDTNFTPSNGAKFAKYTF